MMFKRNGLAAAATAALLATSLAAVDARAQEAQYFPGLQYRSGPFAPSGIPFANGFRDYLAMLNERDGGVNGIRIHYEECDTAYNNDRGVECYERLKGAGPSEPAVWNPLSTGITYALIERATADKAPIISMGYGRADASDGRVFPYVFTLPATYWAGADAMIQYIKDQEGGDLSGKKIALVYFDGAYGKEPIPTLERLSKEEGFTFRGFPVASPGLEQKATWLQIGRQFRPDWTLMWGWGVMNSTAIKEAAAVGYPMEKFIGIWWSGSENDVMPAGDAATGYKSLGFHAPGTDFPAIQDIVAQVYDGDEARAKENNLGHVLYNRGVMNAVLSVEAMRTAQEEYGARVLTGEEMRWGIENLEITAERWKEMGLEGFANPIKLSCEDHEGGGSAFIQQWDGDSWEIASDWILPNRTELRPAYEASAAQYAEEKGITPRECN